LVDVSVIGLAGAIADSPQFSILPMAEATRFDCTPVCCASGEGSILAATVAAAAVFECNVEIGYEGESKLMSTPILMEHCLIKEQLIEYGLDTFP
jgi:hypothetical protein